MSRTRIVKGNITEITKGTSRIFGKSIQINSSGRIEYFAQNYTYGDPQPPPLKVMDGAVKEIELLTALDQGSKNDKSGTYQDGMIFGKSYHFKVKSYFQNPPVNITDIKWMLKYHSASQNKWIEIPLSSRGDSVTITMNDEDMCGRFVYVRAYVYSAEKEAEYKEWKHNRFRWFDRMIIEDEITERTDNGKPWLIDQSGTSLCGMACIFYLFAKEQPDGYKKFAKELFRTGVATFNSYTVKPSIEILEKNPMGKNFPHNGTPMFLIDFITMAGTRNTDNPDYKGGNEEFHAINWPWVMTNLGKNLLGYKTVEMDYYKINKSYIRDFFGSDEKIRILEKNINTDYKNGYKISLLIDASMLGNDDSYSLDDFSEYHWIVNEGNLQLLNTNNISENNYDYVSSVKFDVFSWGEEVKGKSRTSNGIKKSAFINNYYGYLKMK